MPLIKKRIAWWLTRLQLLSSLREFVVVMKRIFFLAVLVLFNQLVSNAQQDSIAVEIISKEGKRIIIDPFNQERAMNDIGSFAVHLDSANLFNSYGGSSVLNVLRAYMPNIDQPYSFTTPGPVSLRGNQTMLVIDGVPFDMDIISIYNLNAFEYKSITAVADPNATTLYGDPGRYGGVFLQSKTGEGYVTPLLEFNSYNTVELQEDHSPSAITSQMNRWLFSQSAAYAQDFGDIDTRVSYNYTTEPLPSDYVLDGSNRMHSLRWNTGAEISDRFSARLIMDYRRKDNELGPYSDNGFVDDSESILQGNLVLQGQLTPWLNFSSRHVLTTSSDHRDMIMQSAPASFHVDRDRMLNNLYLSANKSKSWGTFRVVSGIQQDEFMRESMSDDSGNDYQSEMTFKNFSIMGGIGATYKNLVNLDINARNEKISDDSESVHLSSLSAAVAFHFTKLLMPTSKSIEGRFHGSWGGLDYIDAPLYFESDPLELTVSEAFISRNQSELGLDFSFFNRRMNTHVNYFWMRDHQGLENVSYWTTSMKRTGIEVGLRAHWLTTNSMTCTSGVLFYQYRSTKPEYGYDNVTLPNYRGTLVNEVKWNRVTLTALINFRHGRDMVGYQFYEGSYLKLREFAIGYEFDPSGLAFLKKVHIIASARNMLSTNKSNEDLERIYNYNLYAAGSLKSISLSITANF
jgi:hypothetical protein